jgi:multisubunit Na+/H+ antiporter MnhG subunit
MNLDIRLPIGMMFTLFGLLLAGFGLLGDKQIYERSLGININLMWGIVLLLFGVVMFALAWMRKAATSAQTNSGEGQNPSRGH